MFKNKTIITIVAVFILALLAYGIFGTRSKTSSNGVVKQAVGTSANTTTVNPSAALDGPGKEFVAQLLAIQNITFNLDLFKDPVFQGMQDFSREIQPQEAGRPNPFAPLGDDSRIGSPQTPEQAVSNIATPPSKAPAKKTQKK